ncbi:hypothetical protein KSC_107960 [Ktedonobacter sp. SOSP1-52]|uniref:hypothetical protein n=1 Tax=Ktedonobacter sp. SOSP1-52 TaxID=2778366 RepID=UPI0019160385|nr:hypothetical protein [Ktedonobacter sp. SOSP1-52]GHO71904.1 hypothetical protein KSC_107960 [Ktedonobacter sp. SOSP1-52]
MLVLLWCGLYFGVYWVVGDLLHLYLFTNFIGNLFLWLTFAFASISLAWSFSRGKPHVAYGGLHVFFALCCFGMVFLLVSPIAQEMLFFLALGISLLLFIFHRPILASLPEHAETAPVKWAEEDPLSYQAGYRSPRSEGVYEEGGQYFPYPDREQAQAQIFSSQTDH